jgi:hypothetical protein
VSCRNVGALLQTKPDSVFEKLVRWADAVWIVTGELAVAERVKRIKKLPVLLICNYYEPICPIMWFSYGFNGVAAESAHLGYRLDVDSRHIDFLQKLDR